MLILEALILIRPFFGTDESRGWIAMKGAKLRNASMRGAKLSSARLMDADLSFADLTDVELIGADLQGAEFEWSNAGQC